MAKLSRDLGSETLHPRETLYASGMLGAVGAELVIATDGCAALSLDMRGSFTLSVELAGSIDGINWTLIPVRLLAGGSPAYVAQISGSQPGSWIGAVSGYRLARVRCTAWTSGAAAVTLAANLAPPEQSLSGMVTSSIATVTGPAGSAATLTLASPGAGLRHYLTYLSINRFAAAALTAAATPVTISSSNLPGGLAFTFEADAAVMGTMVRWREDFAFPLAATTPNSATSISCPATAGVIWRVTAGFYVGP